MPFDVMVQPKERGGLGLQDPARKAAAMFAARWETAARADMTNLSGCWLRHLQREIAEEDSLPACLKHFTTSCRTEAFDAVLPDLLGKAITQRLYAAALAVNVPVPRAMREVAVEDQQQVWRCVHAKHLPVNVRSVWFEVVHDVLPTAIRLQAARQAEVPDCPKCEEPEDVVHRLARCGAGRKAAWSWAVQHIKDATGMLVDEGTITRPALMSEPGGAEATTIMGSVVHFMASRRNVDENALRRYMVRLRITEG